MKFIVLLTCCFLITTPLFAEQYQAKNTNKRLLSAEKDDSPLSYMLVPYRVKKLWGFSDEKGNLKIAPQYDDVKQIKYYWADGSSFQSVMVVSKGGAIFAINHLNQVIVPADGHFDELDVDYYYYGVVVVTKQGKKGIFYNRKQIVPCQYTYIEREKNLSFRVSTNGKSGIINSKGKIVVPVEYYGMRVKDSDREHVTWIAGNDKNKNDEFKDDLVVDPGKQESHTYSINEVSQLNLSISQTQQDTIIKNLRKIYPDAVMDRQYSYLIYVKKDGKWGIFNILKNKLTVPYEYDDLKVEKNTMPKITIRAKKGDLYGYIDENNTILAPIIFKSIITYYNNFILSQPPKVGMLTSGQKYIAPRYLKIDYSESIYDAKTESLQEFYMVLTSSGKKGYVNSAGFEYFID
ncbi:MAG: WG repeat-containing protein [Bacteroidota bacterium]